MQRGVIKRSSCRVMAVPYMQALNTNSIDEGSLMKIFFYSRAVLLVCLAQAATIATAHVVLEQRSAIAGSYYKGVLRITHGCEGSATTRVTVQLPEGFRGAKPMIKAGWTISAPKAKLAQAYESHGKQITEDVSTITWSAGSLPDALYDEMAFMGRLPDTPGKLYFKVLQECEKGRHDWSAIPAEGKKLSDYPEPAAELTVTPKEMSTHH
jgi:periplasmic copper chaperone A